MESYTEMHTRHLLGKLKKTRATLTRGPDWDDDPWPPEKYAALETEIAALKKVLATREHVPSTLDGKVARRLKAAQNRGQGKSRNR